MMDRAKKIEMGIAIAGVGVSVVGIYLYQRSQGSSAADIAAQEQAAANAEIASMLQSLPSSSGASSGGTTGASGGTTVPPLDTSAGGLLDSTGPTGTTSATSQTPESIQAASNAAMLAEGYTIVNGQFVPPAAPAAPTAPATAAGGSPTPGGAGFASRVAAVTNGLFGTAPVTNKATDIPIKVIRRTAPAVPAAPAPDAGGRSTPPVDDATKTAGSGRIPVPTSTFVSRVSAVTNGLFGTAAPAKDVNPIAKVLLRGAPSVVTPAPITDVPASAPVHAAPVVVPVTVKTGSGRV
jgi:hypothetical protein